MQKITSCGVLAIAASLCAVDADAGPTKLSAKLSGGEQVIDTAVATNVTLPVVGLVTGAYGEASFTVSPDRNTISYTLKVSKTGSPVFMAHIHLGPPGRNGPIVVWLFGDPTHNPLPFTFPRTDPPFGSGGTDGGTVSGVLTAGNPRTAFSPQTTLGLESFQDLVANILAGNALCERAHRQPSAGGNTWADRQPIRQSQFEQTGIGRFAEIDVPRHRRVTAAMTRTT